MALPIGCGRTLGIGRWPGKRFQIPPAIPPAMPPTMPPAMPPAIAPPQGRFQPMPPQPQPQPQLGRNGLKGLSGPRGLKAPQGRLSHQPAPPGVCEARGGGGGVAVSVIEAQKGGGANAGAAGERGAAGRSRAGVEAGAPREGDERIPSTGAPWRVQGGPLRCVLTEVVEGVEAVGDAVEDPLAGVPSVVVSNGVVVAARGAGGRRRYSAEWKE